MQSFPVEILEKAYITITLGRLKVHHSQSITTWDRHQSVFNIKSKNGCHCKTISGKNTQISSKMRSRRQNLLSHSPVLMPDTIFLF